MPALFSICRKYMRALPSVSWRNIAFTLTTPALGVLSEIARYNDHIHPRLSLGKRLEPTALFESDRRQLTFECPAAVIFRDSDEQFVVAWVEMDTGLVVKAERTERVISAV